MFRTRTRACRGTKAKLKSWISGKTVHVTFKAGQKSVLSLVKMWVVFKSSRSERSGRKSASHSGPATSWSRSSCIAMLSLLCAGT